MSTKLFLMKKIEVMCLRVLRVFIEVCEISIGIIVNLKFYSIKGYLIKEI